MLPEKKLGTATIISRHTSPRMRWPKPEKQIPEWITQIYNFLRPYSSHHIYTDGSYKKLPWIRRHLSGRRRPSSSGQNGSGIQNHHCPAIRGLERQTTLPIAVLTHQNGGTIGAQSMYPMELMAIVAALQLAAHIQVLDTDSFNRMLSNSQKEAK